MITIKASQKIFTYAEVANLTGICAEHLHNYDGLTIAGCEAKFITRVARRTVLSANAMSVLVPVLEKVMNWDSAKIRRFFASYGLTLLEWEKMRTDILTIQDSPVPVAPASDASAASPQIDAH